MTGDELEEIEQLAGRMLARLAPGKRRAVLRKMAFALAASQRRRISAQRNPDGSKFADRAPPSPPAPGRGPACFLYPTSGGGTRKVVLKSFAWEGRKMTGFDQEAGAIRSFNLDKVAQWLPVPAGVSGGGTKRRRGGLRRRAMFRRLGSGKFLRAGNTDRELWAGFSGQASAIARVHQFGLRDRPSLRAKAVKYPRRELLGATPADRRVLLDSLMAQVAGE